MYFCNFRPWLTLVGEPPCKRLLLRELPDGVLLVVTERMNCPNQKWVHLRSIGKVPSPFLIQHSLASFGLQRSLVSPRYQPGNPSLPVAPRILWLFQQPEPSLVLAAQQIIFNYKNPTENDKYSTGQYRRKIMWQKEVEQGPETSRKQKAIYFLSISLKQLPIHRNTG